MLDVYSDGFQSVYNGLKSIATAMDAEEVIRAAKVSIESTLAERIEQADKRAKADTENYRQHHPDATAEQVKDLYEELRDRYRREQHRKRDQEIGKLSRRFPAEYAVLQAVSQMEKDWYLSPQAVEYLAEAVSELDKKTDNKPGFDFETLDAIRRGYTAHDADSAASAKKKAKADRKKEQDERQAQIARENAARLRAEQEELERHIQEQEAPRKRLAEVKKELAKVGGGE